MDPLDLQILIDASKLITNHLKRKNILEAFVLSDKLNTRLSDESLLQLCREAKNPNP